MFSSMRTLMWIAMVGVLLTMGYWFAKPTSPAKRAVPATEQNAAAAVPLKEFSVQIGAKDAKPAQPVFRVTKGDEVAIRVASDQAGALMLHGYTDGVAVAKNGVATVHFKATHTGRFPLHLHGEGGSHVELATLEIMPR